MEKVKERSCLYANTTCRHGVHIVPMKQIEETVKGTFTCGKHYLSGHLAELQ